MIQTNNGIDELLKIVGYKTGLQKGKKTLTIDAANNTIQTKSGSRHFSCQKILDPAQGLTMVIFLFKIGRPEMPVDLN